MPSTPTLQPVLPPPPGSDTVQFLHTIPDELKALPLLPFFTSLAARDDAAKVIELQSLAFVPTEWQLGLPGLGNCFLLATYAKEPGARERDICLPLTSWWSEPRTGKGYTLTCLESPLVYCGLGLKPHSGKTAAVFASLVVDLGDTAPRTKVYYYGKKPLAKDIVDATTLSDIETLAKGLEALRAVRQTADPRLQ